VSTAVLLFTRTDSGGTDQVWFYDMQADGLSLDDKRQPVAQNDIPDVLNRWHNLAAEKKRTRIEKSFFVPVEEILGNNYDLSINRYKEVKYEQKQYDKPKDIITRIDKLDEARAVLLEELESLLAENLNK